MSSVDRDFANNENFVIGNDLGRYAAVYRIILAVYLIAIFILKPLVLDPQPLDEFWSLMGETAMWVVVIAAIYFAVFYILNGVILERMHPWARTALFLGTPTILGLLGYIPTPVSIGFGIYDALTLFLAVKMRYGGCEVIALPTYVLGRRYTAYCGLNLFDLMERALVNGRAVRQSPVLSIISITLVLFVVSYFSFVANVIKAVNLDFAIDQKWVYLLVIPILYLASITWQIYRSEGLRHKYTRWFGFGVIILTLYMLRANDFNLMTPIWNALSVLGVAYGLYQIGNWIRTRKSRRAASET